MTKPIVAITSYQKTDDGATTVRLGNNYVKAVLRAGGIPVLVPPSLSPADADALLHRVDALLLTGGADIDPKIFNGKDHPSVYEIDNERDAIELALVQRAVDRDLPFLGICRGIQAINVALGGTLYTDIADQLEGSIKHDYYPGYRRDHQAHGIRLESDSRLARTFGVTETTVNSLHHQGIEQLAQVLRPLAYAPDGLIEAVEIPGHRFALGVQWHPEAMPHSPLMQALFRAFLDSANGHRS